MKLKPVYQTCLFIGRSNPLACLLPADCPGVSLLIRSEKGRGGNPWDKSPFWKRWVTHRDFATTINPERYLGFNLFGYYHSFTLAFQRFPRYCESKEKGEVMGYYTASLYNEKLDEKCQVDFQVRYYPKSLPNSIRFSVFQSIFQALDMENCPGWKIQDVFRLTLDDEVKF